MKLENGAVGGIFGNEQKARTFWTALDTFLDTAGPTIFLAILAVQIESGRPRRRAEIRCQREGHLLVRAGPKRKGGITR